MAGALVRGFNRPTNTHQPNVDPRAPQYYYPGTYVADPKYAQKKTSYDQMVRSERDRDAAANRGMTDFLNGVYNNANYGMTFSDPRTGVSYAYPNGGRAGGGAGGAGGELEDFNFYDALAKARSAMPGKLAPAQLPGRVQASTPADAAAAEAAEFGRAKDRIGKLGRGSMMALQEQLDARGMGGAGYEADATSQVLNEVTGQTGEVIRDQAIQALVRQRQVEDRNYQGDIAQRGQDIGFTTTTRGQDANYELGRYGMITPLMSLIAANRRRRLY